MLDPKVTAAIRTAFNAFNARDFATFATYMAEDVVETYPQSGEQLIGRDQQRGMHEAFPSPPIFTIREIRGDGDVAAVEVDEAYADGSTWKSVLILEFRNGLVAALTGYFGEPFNAPAWRAPFRVRP